jgi:sporulation inhibitor KapD
MSKDYLVTDLEFSVYKRPTGRPRGFFSEVIEIGAVRIAGDTNEIAGKIQDFVKPHFYPKQAWESMGFCSITEADMKTAIDFSAMLKQLIAMYVPGKTYFVTWGNEDFKVIDEGCKRHNLVNPILPEDCLDLAAAYRLMKGESRTTGLRKATEELNVNQDGHWHAAYDDAYKTGNILLELLSAGWKPEEYFDRTRRVAKAA